MACAMSLAQTETIPKGTHSRDGLVINEALNGIGISVRSNVQVDSQYVHRYDDGVGSRLHS